MKTYMEELEFIDGPGFIRIEPARESMMKITISFPKKNEVTVFVSRRFIDAAHRWAKKIKSLR